MAKKRKPAAATVESGFPAKFRKYLRLNREAYEEGRGNRGPRNPRQFGKEMAGIGPEPGYTTVLGWYDGESLPRAEHIGQIEALMGAPWRYLHDPKTPWPRAWTREALTDLVALFPDDALERLAARVRSELGSPRATRSG